MHISTLVSEIVVVSSEKLITFWSTFNTHSQLCCKMYSAIYCKVRSVWQSFDLPMIHQREDYVVVLSWSVKEDENILKSKSLKLRTYFLKSKILMMLFFLFFLDSQETFFKNCLPKVQSQFQILVQCQLQILVQSQLQILLLLLNLLTSEQLIF